MGTKEVNGFTAVIRAIKRRDGITEGGRIETSTREGGDRRSEGQGKNSRWPERPGRGESGPTRSPRPSTAPTTHAPPRPRPRRRDHAKRARASGPSHVPPAHTPLGHSSRILAFPPIQLSAQGGDREADDAAIAFALALIRHVFTERLLCAARRSGPWAHSGQVHDGLPAPTGPVF